MQASGSSVVCLSTFANDVSSEAVRPVFFYISHTVYLGGGRVIVFCSCRIRTLVATSSQCLIMGKVEIWYFCSFGRFEFCSTEMFIE